MSKILNKRLFILTILSFIFLFGFSITTHAKTVVKENAVYWETSEDGGSGRNNIVNDENPYISEDRTVTINGYSFLDSNGNIIDSKFVLNITNNIKIPTAPKGTVMTMLHIHSENYRLGWTDEANLTPADIRVPDEPQNIEQPQKKTAEEFADSINQKEGKTLILVDQSGSMNDFIEESTRAFNSLDLTDVEIMVFAEKQKKISADEINDFHPSIGGGTDIYSAMNKADGYENIVLISDLADNHNTELFSFSTVKTLEIMCPDEYYPEEDLNKIKTIWSNVDISIYIID